MKDRYFIIDFDSTFIKLETLDVLASYVLKDRTDREEIVGKIKEITEQGMNGEISFDDSLRLRMSYLSPTREDLAEVVKILKKNVTDSISRNKDFFKKNADRIYIISGGFKELIGPVTESYAIAPDHILANTFVFDKNGKFEGYDHKNPLSKADGKVEAVKKLGLKGELIVIGDGYTDLRLRESGVVSKFFVFTENINREKVTVKADRVASNFDEVLFAFKLPMSVSYPKSKINVLLLENIDRAAVDHFEAEGYAVESLTQGLSEDELIAKLNDIHVLGIRSRTQITERVLSKAKRFMAVGAYCIGTNQIDLRSASSYGTVVFNAPYSNTRSVVELVIGFIFALSREFVIKNNNLHKGVWDKSAKGLHEVRGKTLGIIGYGNIGSQLSVLAENLGMDVIYYDIVERLAMGNAKSCTSMSELLKKADFVTVHVDGRSENKYLIGEKEFAQMKNGVKFINTSRGFVVDIKALIKYLRSGKIKGAALDVFPVEPKSRDEEFVSELRGFENVILTPHVGAGTEEAQKSIADFVSRKIIDHINTGDTYLSVNFPNIQVSRQKNSHRILHVHRNVPGILAKINGILARNNMNILGQYLKTNEQIGYVITDVNKKYNQNVLDELKKIPDTIKMRVLY